VDCLARQGLGMLFSRCKPFNEAGGGAEFPPWRALGSVFSLNLSPCL